MALMAGQSHLAIQLQQPHQSLRLGSWNDGSKSHDALNRDARTTPSSFVWHDDTTSHPNFYALPLRSVPSRSRHQGGGYDKSLRDSHDSEHLLRRKTPFGTLNAAYDGRPVESTGHSHAQKYVLLPENPTTRTYQDRKRLAHPDYSHYQSQPPMLTWNGAELPLIATDFMKSSTWQNGPFHCQGQNILPVDSAMFGMLPTHGVLPQSIGGRTPANFMEPFAASPLGPTISNVHGPFGPYWPNGTFVPYQPATFRDPRHEQHASNWPGSATDPRLVQPSGRTSYQHDMNQRIPFGLGQPAAEPHLPKDSRQSQVAQSFRFLTHRNNGPLQDLGQLKEALAPGCSERRNQAESQSNYHRQLGAFHSQTIGSFGGRQECTGPFSGSSSPPSLKPIDLRHTDKVLAWAHSIYDELVSFVQETRRLNQNPQHALDSGYLPRGQIYPSPVRRVARKGNAGKDSRRETGHVGFWDNSKQQTSPKSRRHSTSSANGARDFHGQAVTNALSNHFNHGLPQGTLERQRQVQKQHLAENLPPSIAVASTSANSNSLKRGVAEAASIAETSLRTRSDPRPEASDALETLAGLCRESGLRWMEGMLLAGCLAYVLGDIQAAVNWFSKIMQLDPKHAEANSNLAAAFLSQNRRKEAEHYWFAAVHIRPDYFEAAEHLLGLLCTEHRHRDAVALIECIQRALEEAPNSTGHDDTSVTRQGRGPETTFATQRNGYSQTLSDIFGTAHSQSQSGSDPTFKRPNRRYSIHGSDIGRLIALIHAKGNILYNLQDHIGAARAFEDVILLATDYQSGGMDDLIKLIHSVLLRSELGHQYDSLEQAQVNAPLLLSPNKALQTATRCFPPYGQLPGLFQVKNKTSQKAAVSVTSNSLLSLAKIFQDSMSANISTSGIVKAYCGVRDILALYYLSLSLQPSPSTANNVGILLASVQQAARPNFALQASTQDEFTFPGVLPGSGVALALKYYQYGLNLDSKHAHLFTNLGSLLKDIGQLSMAIKMYEKAVACDGNFDIALANLANAVKDQGKTGEAIQYYKRAVRANPNFAEAVCGLTNALNSVCDWTGRGGSIMAKGFDRWHVDDHGNLLDARGLSGKGSGWVNRVLEIVATQLTEGESWGRGLISPAYAARLSGHLATHHMDPKAFEERIRRLISEWTGQSWEGARLVRFVERAIRRIGWQWYHDKYVKKRQVSEDSYQRPPLPETLSIPGAPTVLPFHTFTLPMTAKQIRLISQRNGLRVSCTTLRASWLPKTVYPPPPPPSPRLNVAYISSDFNNHPLAHLMQSVFGMHDHKRFKIFCFATTASDNSVHRQKIMEEAPVFYDASAWPVERLVQQVVHDNIHILINLNGYTRGARNEVFAARPAPIQMSFMGFAGTMGSEWCDYLLADEIAIPRQTLRPWRGNVTFDDITRDENHSGADENWVYGENVIYARDTFFCCDHKQSCDPSERDVTWQQEQSRRWKMRKELFPDLKDDAIILGNFNQLYKIEPTTFRTWLRILSRVPNAILWLLRFPDLGESHLRATALAWAGPSIASRIVFTDVAPKSQHILRACVADLFLDTPECNAHTTAADCLWSGTPLLTLPRYEWKMCSRMAASILGGALPRHTQAGRDAWDELVAHSEEEYENTAVTLGCGLKYQRRAGAGRRSDGKAEGRLADLRKLIWSHRWESKLFDTRRWVSDLEAAYEEAWRRWVVGKSGDIWLRDIVGDSSAPPSKSAATARVNRKGA